MKYLGLDYKWYSKIMFYILRKFYKYKPPNYNDREMYIKTLEKCYEIIDEKGFLLQLIIFAFGKIFLIRPK